jgi:lipoic acid synthetase
VKANEPTVRRTAKSPFPEWIRRGWASGQNVEDTRDLVKDLNLHTVCQSANCPNLGDCWKRRTATFMILGNLCTRNCRYCSVPSGKPDGTVDAEEPLNVAKAVQSMGIKHAVITSVTRDDLSDGGAQHFVETIQACRELNPDTTIELLTPDFLGDEAAIQTVVEARPEVFGHNIETVERLYPTLRGRRYAYDLGLSVLRAVAQHPMPTLVKSAFMVGHGESEQEVRQTLQDLLEAGCDAVSIGQYLRPSRKQRKVEEFVHPDQLTRYEEMAYELGFQFAVAGPFVRSSYRSEELVEQEFAQERIRAAREYAALQAQAAQAQSGAVREVGREN